MGRPEAFYRLYERRLTRGLDPERLPRHIGVLVDGNRRWARAFGASTQQGHQAGAERILDFIGWCDEAGIPVVTLYMLSTENLRRPAEELAPLLEIIQTTAERLAQPPRAAPPSACSRSARWTCSPSPWRDGSPRSPSRPRATTACT